MDHQSILERMAAPPAVGGRMPGTGVSQSATVNVSAGIAPANPSLPKAAEQRSHPAEEGGHSLAEMAQSDLDAALQLLVDRAQYITGASGAAIALRRGQHNDMLCRASAGSNAPELGAVLSMEYGLSGECARTRQALRCDDAEHDPRVNHEVCRRLGIASVLVMPIVSEEQVLGVFELFSGKARAFEERDVSALQRLSEMVETAVKYAVATQTPPALPVTEPPPSEPEKKVLNVELEKAQSAPVPVPVPKKPLFWSAAMQTPSNTSREETAESIVVPPVLRNLQKCQACGFPVSQGRTFCVECEEKKWRGQRLPQPAASTQTPAQPKEPARRELAVPAAAVAVTASAPAESAAVARPSAKASSTFPNVLADGSRDFSGSGSSALFSGSAAPSGSWFSANKFVLGALLVVAIVIAAIAWLR
jgi:hypothetical protein